MVQSMYLVQVQCRTNLLLEEVFAELTILAVTILYLYLFN